MTFATCDICDANEDKLGIGALAVLPPLFQSFGKQAAFAGPASSSTVASVIQKKSTAAISACAHWRRIRNAVSAKGSAIAISGYRLPVS